MPKEKQNKLPDKVQAFVADKSDKPIALSTVSDMKSSMPPVKPPTGPPSKPSTTTDKNIDSASTAKKTAKTSTAMKTDSDSESPDDPDDGVVPTPAEQRELDRLRRELAVLKVGQLQAEKM